MSDYSKTHETAKAIAAALGEPWHYDVKGSQNADGELHWFATITDGEHKINIGTRGYGKTKDRWEIRANLPTRDARGEIHHADEYPSITISDTATPQRIAADIRRRLLPALVLEHAKQVERIGSYNASYSARGDIAAKLSAAMPGIVHGDCFSPELPDSVYGSVKIHSGYCGLDISGLSVEQVIAMLRIARGEDPP